MASHILCDCEELAVLRFWHLGHSVLKASDFARISISMVLHCVQSTGLLKPWAKGYTKDWKQSRCEIHSNAHPNLLYLLYPNPIMPTHLPHYPILKSPQSTIFPQCDRLSFVLIYYKKRERGEQNYRHKITSYNHSCENTGFFIC